ncbi:hypothetical protein OX283_014415 [Flavobacterium sp. SUN052]|uniref:hypothetical protein n=1 Tax=Flavobacterium sp. SUN052 TaxID=3002441 RepID=UPI00237D9905|nr:hypothetical protein [Flavobacterium sp. SUN052]MEC4005861.1 hypothetical protein [Flavobacterium sp. SUN052]
MNKNLLYFLIFLTSINSYSQIKDTIRLEEVKILSTNKKVEHLKTKGKLSSLTGNLIKGIISKVDEIPDGKLSSIKFFFNSSPLFYIKDTDKADYRDVELGLLIYNVKEDGTPGELLIDKVIIFKLNSKNQKFIELDLKPLYLNSSKTMFFGIELLNKQIGKDFKIMTKCNNENSNLLYMKTWKSEKWYSSDIPCEMKLDIGITVIK